MPLITAVAYLEFCECRNHGQFVLADGSRSCGFYSKRTAFTILKLFRQEGKISESEHIFLKDQISNSDLPLCDEDAHPVVAIVCRRANEEGESLTPKGPDKEKPFNFIM
jgi:hypothetical protein